MAKRYLITGVAGSGKSTLEKIFRKKGYITADIDNGFAEWRHAETDEFLEYKPEDSAWHSVAEWVVNSDRLQHFFDQHTDEIVLIFGSFARRRQVTPLFSTIILLEYPDVEFARRRIAGRKDGYGSNAAELARIMRYIIPYQNTMKEAGAISVSCTLSIEESVRAIEKIIVDRQDVQRATK